MQCMMAMAMRARTIIEGQAGFTQNYYIYDNAKVFPTVLGQMVYNTHVALTLLHTPLRQVVEVFKSLRNYLL